MDFTPEELDLSSPCFLVENSQSQETETIFRSDSARDLAILKQLTRLSTSRTDHAAGISRDDLSFPTNCAAISCSTAGGEGTGREEDETSRQQDDHGHHGHGRDSGGGDERGGSDGGGGDDNGGGDGGDEDGEGDVGGGEGGGGGGGGGGDGDDGDNDEYNEQGPSTNEEESPHLEERSSSSDALPELIRPEAAVFSGSLGRVLEKDEPPPKHYGGGEGRSGGSMQDSSGDTYSYSQASTGIVSEGADVGNDQGEVSTALVDEEKKSSSPSSVGHKSDHGSAISSSSYHGDLSNLSSESSLQVSLEVHKHLPLLLRKQSTSDTSTSSAGSKEEKVHSKISVFKLYSMEEEPEGCSSQEDLFATSQGNQEGTTRQNLSVDLNLPHHQSTPVDGKNSREPHPCEKSLYKQVLTSKQCTSTPVEGGSGFFCTPPSHGTPIDNMAFQSLHFSGEPSVRESSSSSSSDKMHPSPEGYNSIPVLEPSSPSAGDEEQVGKKSNRKERTYEKECEDRQVQKPKSINRLVENDTEKEQSEISRAAAELMHSFDLSQTQEKHLKKPVSPRLRESLDDEKVELPLWQQKQQQEALQQAALQQASDTNEEKLSNGSSQGTSSEDSSKGEPSPQLQQWQPVSSALGTSSSGSALSKEESTVLTLNGAKEPCTVLITDSYLNSPKPLISDLPVEHLKESLHEKQLSQSPSSLVIDPFKSTKSKAADAEGSPPVLPGPTQPEMSEDMFLPVVVGQESKKQRSISDGPPDQSVEEQNVKEVFDSQDIMMPFSLHLTQSQSNMGSQMPADISQGTEGIQMNVIVSEVTNNVTVCKLTETIQAEETGSLTKQDSGSQSILAPLRRPLPTMALAQGNNVKEHLTMEVPTNASENLVRSTEGIYEIYRELSIHSSPDQGDVIHLSEKTPAVEESGGVTQHVEHEAPDDLVQEQASIPEMGTEMTFREKDMSDDLEKEQPSSARVHARKLIKPTLPAAIFSEPSSDSGTSFHFSLPREPLRPLMSTTPPPLRPVRQDTPDSEGSSRRSTIPDVVLPVVRETPGMSSQEPAIHFEPNLLVASTSTESLHRLHTSAPMPPRSIFSRAREAIAKTKTRGVREVQSDDDPFAFTADDDVPEPVRKKPKRGSPRGTPGIETRTRTEVVNTPNAKRVREERGFSSDSEGLEEALSKQARREDDEPKPDRDEAGKATSSSVVHYKQIMCTRTVTTVTTQVKRNVTMTIVDEESGKVVQVLTFEEDGEPKVESQEEEKEEVSRFVETSKDDGSRVTVSAGTPKREKLQQKSRSSPRRKNGRSPTSKQASCASGKIRALVTSGKSSSDRSSEDKGKGNGDDPQTGDEPTEIPSISRQATEPVVEEESNLKRSSSSDSSFTPGTRVLAKWLDGYFYPGIITAKQYKNGRYLVTFDDGDKRRIPRENLIIKDLLPVGQSVMAQGDFIDDFYEEGVIVGHYRERNERGYEIQTQNGAIRRYPRNRIILSEQQAVAVLSSDSSFNVTSGSSVSIGTHSLRRSGSSNTSLHVISKSGSVGAKDTSRDTSSKDTSSNDERTGKKNADRATPRGSPRHSKAESTDMDITPKSTHKSSHKVKAQARRAGQRIGESESSSDEQHGKAGGKRRYVKRGLSSTYGPKSPVRPVGTLPPQPVGGHTSHKQINERDDTEPHLPKNRIIFAGLAFLVTGMTRDKNEPEETDSESERIDFNRDHLKRQIEAGGGVVLSSFPQSQISGAECLLISHTHQRTQKYFQSLASGIPCVSHIWIIDCCACDKRLDYKRYLLPAGESLEEGEIVECRPRRNILGGMRVYLHGSQQFKATWSSVLLAAGCNMVAKLPGRFDYECDVIICEDHKLPASVKHAANLLEIPIVSLEWLLQTLINGRRVLFDGHPKYDYRYKNA